ncbi:MAG: hypothetical protein Q9180_005933, partial [Flavoplaca navasiana]
NAVIFKSGSSTLTVKAGVEQMVTDRKKNPDEQRGHHQARSEPVDLWHDRDVLVLGRSRCLVDEDGFFKFRTRSGKKSILEYVNRHFS